jgi:hypothetical protein
MDILDALPAGRGISDDILDIAQREGNVHLEPNLRERVRRRIEAYERQTARVAAFRGSRSDRERIDRIIKGIEVTLRELEALEAQNPTLARYLIWEAMGEFVERLKSIHKSFTAHRKNSKRGKPENLHLGVLLFGLEQIFIDASGNAKTGIMRRNNERHSAFIDFAWPIVHEAEKRIASKRFGSHMGGSVRRAKKKQERRESDSAQTPKQDAQAGKLD